VLVDGGVDFVLCGGVACILHGVARATRDLDLRVALETDNLARLIRVARSLDLVPRIPEQPDALLDAARRQVWIAEKQAVVYTMLAGDGLFAVDVFLRYPIPFDALAAAAVTVPVGGRDVAVSSITHLIEAKRAVVPPRPVDLRDIADLEALRER
jgi:hypothetical protein